MSTVGGIVTPPLTKPCLKRYLHQLGAHQHFTILILGFKKAIDQDHLDIKVIPKGCIYNIGSGKEYLILDIVKFVANSLNYKGKITCNSNSQSYDGSSWYADIDKLKSIGFKSNYGLQEGLHKTIEFWKINK